MAALEVPNGERNVASDSQIPLKALESRRIKRKEELILAGETRNMAGETFSVLQIQGHVHPSTSRREQRKVTGITGLLNKDHFPLKKG